MVVIILAIGFIFKDYFNRRQQIPDEEYDPLRAIEHSRSEWWRDLFYAAAITAPAIIIHEMGHKFVAMAFGLVATFKAAYTWLALGIIFKLINFPIIFVPAYVQFPGGSITPFEHFLIAFAGPGMNLIMWLGAGLLVRHFDARQQRPQKRSGRQKSVSWEKYAVPLRIFAKINMFLFFFNLIPIPPFDGYWVFKGLFETFF